MRKHLNSFRELMMPIVNEVVVLSIAFLLSLNHVLSITQINFTRGVIGSLRACLNTEFIDSTIFVVIKLYRRTRQYAQDHLRTSSFMSLSNVFGLTTINSSISSLNSSIRYTLDAFTNRIVT